MWQKKNFWNYTKLRLKNYKMLFPFITGFISAIGQIILLRELMIELNGNEIIFSIFLSLWLLLVAAGTFAFGFLKDKLKNEKTLYFSTILLIFILMFQFVLIHKIVPLFSDISGELIKLPTLFSVAFLVLLPGCFFIGFLFPLNCAINSNRNSIKKVYIMESVGMAIGGLIFFVLINFMNNFSIVTISAAISFLLMFIILKKKSVIIFILILFIISIFSSYLFINSYAARYRPNRLILSQDSKFGRFDVTLSQNQENYYWDGELFGNSQNFNQTEELINFVFLQHPNPKKILLVGGLLNGYAEQIFKIDNRARIDYLEMEKNIISFYRRKHPNLSDKIRFIIDDPIKYFLKTHSEYDLIFIDVPDPTSLFLNRFYTREFFQTVKNHLADKNAIFVCTVSNSANFLIPELAKLNGIIWGTLKTVFPNVVFVPASKSLYIAGNSDYVSNNSGILIRRANEKNLVGNWFNSALIFDVCNPSRITYFKNAISKYENEINGNLFPKAYLLTILFWTKHLNFDLNQYFASAENLKIPILFAVFFSVIVFSYLFGKQTAFKQTYNIMSISFFAFVMQLILIYLTQIYFGFVYLIISLFTVSFMLGLTLGFQIGSRLKISIPFLFLLNLILTIFLILFIRKMLPVYVLYSLNFVIAVLEGIVLVKNLDELKMKKAGKLEMKFYFLDTFGATLGGFLTGVFLIPLFGILPVIFLLLFVLFGNVILGINY